MDPALQAELLGLVAASSSDREHAWISALCVNGRR
jgi:hypothetical protein